MRALLVLLFMAVSIQWGFAQLNLNVSRGTLGTVIEQIKSQSKYQFFYDDKLAALSVENVKVNNVSIEDALNVILKGKNISYKVEDNIVYLSEKTATSQEGKQQGKAGQPDCFRTVGRRTCHYCIGSHLYIRSYVPCREFQYSPPLGRVLDD